LCSTCLSAIAIDEAEIERSSWRKRINFVKWVDAIMAVPPAEFLKRIYQKEANPYRCNYLQGENC
jgi:hypothetical protein